MLEDGTRLFFFSLAICLSFLLETHWRYLIFFCTILFLARRKLFAINIIQSWQACIRTQSGRQELVLLKMSLLKTTSIHCFKTSNTLFYPLWMNNATLQEIHFISGLNDSFSTLFLEKVDKNSELCITPFSLLKLLNKVLVSKFVCTCDSDLI